MLTIQVSTKDAFDDNTQEFISLENVKLEMEHSLVSLSKWESKWEKPFLDATLEKTEDMLIDYIKCMITHDFDEKILNHLTPTQIKEINEYINAKRTATWFNERDAGQRKGPQSKVITSDLIYYWMVAMTIPFSCETWHLNRLITLIRITELENRPKKKMSPKETMSRHRSLNQARRAGRPG